MQKIPKIFHQIWLGGKPLPSRFVAFQKTWKDHHPDWEIKMWNETNLHEIPDINMDDLALCKNYAEQADYLRLFIIKAYGGVYIDTDFECLKSIASLIRDTTLFFSQEKCLENIGISNAIIGGIPQHNFIKYITSLIGERLKKTIDIPSRKSHMRIGPVWIDEIYHTYTDLQNITIFSHELLCPLDPWQCIGGKSYFQSKDVQKSYAIHHYYSSWISIKSRMYRYIYICPYVGKTLFFFLRKLKNMIINFYNKIVDFFDF